MVPHRHIYTQTDRQTYIHTDRQTRGHAEHKTHDTIEPADPQLSLTNRATHLCKCNGVVELRNTRPSPCVLPCRTWSFCIKGCRHKYMRTPKFGSAGTALLGWDACLTSRCTPLHHMWWGYWAKKEFWQYLQLPGYKTRTWQTDTGWQQRPRSHIASHGKNAQWKLRNCIYVHRHEFTRRQCTSITDQYNLVVANGQWCSTVAKVTFAMHHVAYLFLYWVRQL